MQRHLERSRLKMANRIDCVMKGKREGDSKRRREERGRVKEDQRGKENQERTKNQETMHPK